jgi:hypothetical protein
MVNKWLNFLLLLFTTLLIVGCNAGGGGSGTSNSSSNSECSPTITVGGEYYDPELCKLNQELPGYCLFQSQSCRNDCRNEYNISRANGVRGSVLESILSSCNSSCFNSIELPCLENNAYPAYVCDQPSIIPNPDCIIPIDNSTTVGSTVGGTTSGGTTSGGTTSGGTTSGGTTSGGTTSGGTTSGGTTSGGTTSGGTTITNCSILPIDSSCSEYCQAFPAAYGCLADGTNCNSNPTATGCPGSSSVITPNWGVLYPGGEPQEACSASYLPVGKATAFNTRKGTITIAGLATGSNEYSPFSLNAANYLNTSPMLKSVSQAKVFFMSESILKVRFKVKPQPVAAQADTMCYGRIMTLSTIAGYTKLQYYVKVYGVGSDNAVNYLDTKGPITTVVNSCSEALDLSQYIKKNPDQTGIFITVEQVQSNQGSWPADYLTNGFSNSLSYKNVRPSECWGMDIEVAADETNTFD